MARDDTWFPLRKLGFVMTRTPEYFILWSKSHASAFKLNLTAGLILLLCDGKLDAKGIKGRLQLSYPDPSGDIGADILKSFEILLNHQLIDVTDDPPAFPRLLVRVGFSNFWDTFNHEDNYFLWMLTHQLSVLLIDPATEEPDILFYSDFPASQFNHRSVDRNNTLKVRVTFGKDAPDFIECDYAFSSHASNTDNFHRHYQLPFWSLYLDWQNYEKVGTAFYAERLPEEYNPKAACKHFYHSLFSEGIEDIWEETKHMEVEWPVFSLRPENLPQVLPTPVPGELPTRLPSKKTKLTIGMATYDEFDGVYFTIQAIRTFHPEVLDDLELLVIDNNPDGDCAETLKDFSKWIKALRYIPFNAFRGTAVRDIIFREARSEYVLCIDAHIFILPKAIKKLIDFFDTHTDCNDLLQGPLVYDDLENISTHFKPGWSHGMYGQWDCDDRGKSPENEPFEIPMQGLGLFACRKDAWLGFNPRFRGFGGEEGYIHKKFRQAGHATLCLPFLRWMHKFSRPFGTPYGNIWKERIRNYIIGFTELGLDTTPIEDHFSDLLGVEAMHRVHAEIEAELTNPFFYFDAIYCINLDTEWERWQQMQNRFEKLGIIDRVRRFSAIQTPENHHIGCALSHRQIIEDAERQNLNNVMVFEDDAIFLADTLTHLTRSIAELKMLPWDVFHLGGHRWKRRFAKAKGCNFLLHPVPDPTCTQAVAYNRRGFSKMLRDIPDTPDSMKAWLAVHHGIDQYLKGIEGRFLAHPVVASQPSLLAQEDPA